jgi:hypothetical protein
MRALAIGIVCLLAATAGADAIDDLGRGLPKGWKVVRTTGAFAIERVQPVKVAAHHQHNQPSHANVYVVPSIDAVDVTLRLRYRVEPAWDRTRHEHARKKNDEVAALIRTARAKYRIEEIPRSKGRPLPTNDAERARLAEYDATVAKLWASRDVPPTCTLGTFSVFAERDDQMSLIVDPTTAMREMYAIVELVKRRCR